MRWIPLPLDYVLVKYGLKNFRVQLLLGIWIALIVVCFDSVSIGGPAEDFLAGLAGSSHQSLYFSYLTYTPLLIGTLMLFWLGFEWGFIPVFLSAFIIAFSSQMTYYWALLYGIAFVLSLAIYALAYYCVPIDASLRSFRGIVFFIVVSFIAALASSLGSFVWSQFFQLPVWEAILIWKSWWTGVFFQSILLIAPLLIIFTPVINRLKTWCFKDIPVPHVSMTWIYTAIGSVALVLILFIVGAKMLGSQSMTAQLSSLPAEVAQNLRSTNESFEIVTWISIGLILSIGTGGVYLVGSWNMTLKEKVHQQTLEIRENELKLKAALEEREVLLKEIHNRVRYNLTIMLALLEVQLKGKKNKSIEKVIKDSHSRIRSLAVIHETMQQTESVSSVNLKNYAIKLSNRLHQSFLDKNKHIDVSISAEDTSLGIERAVPFGMILNELMVNAYIHAFKDLDKGSLFIEIKKLGDDILLSVRDNGHGLPDNFETKENHSLGMKLIHALARQLQADFEINDYAKPCFSFRMPIHSPVEEAG